MVLHCRIWISSGRRAWLAAFRDYSFDCSFSHKMVMGPNFAAWFMDVLSSTVIFWPKVAACSVDCDTGDVADERDGQQ